jgi:signal transduction histidine kinase
LVQNNGDLNLKIADNGCGFHLDQVNTQDHLGLKGMQERAEMMGGILNVESKPGKGTQINLMIQGKQ